MLLLLLLLFQLMEIFNSQMMSREAQMLAHPSFLLSNREEQEALECQTLKSQSGTCNQKCIV